MFPTWLFFYLTICLYFNRIDSCGRLSFIHPALQLGVLVKCTSWSRRSGAGPEILNFRPSPGWRWCCRTTDHTLWGAGHQPLLSPDTLRHCKGPPPCGTLTSTCFSLVRLLGWVPDFNSHFSSLPDPMSSLPACLFSILGWVSPDWFMVYSLHPDTFSVSLKTLQCSLEPPCQCPVPVYSECLRAGSPHHGHLS